MKLTESQMAKLTRAMNRLESADQDLQAALGTDSEDLHYRIEDLLAEIEQMLDECELVDH